MRVFGWVRDGVVRVEIAETYPLLRAGEAQSDLESRRTSGKLLVIPRNQRRWVPTDAA